MPRQPGLQLALGLHLVLQRPQGAQARVDFGQARGLRLGVMLLGAAGVVERWRLVLQVMQPCVGLAAGGIGLGKLRAQLVQSSQVRRAELARLGLQPLGPLAQRARLLVDVPAVGRQQLDLLLHLRDHAALGVGLGLGIAQPVFVVGQALLRFFGLRGQQFGLGLRRIDLGGNRLGLGLRLGTAVGPLGRLDLQLVQPRLGAAAAVQHVADAFFEPAHRQRGLR